MTEADIKAQPAAEQAGPGARLRVAREAQGRSLDDVVRELHLEPRVVEAIERDQFDDLSAPVFVKGYLRSYARLLGLPEQEVVDAWQPAEPDPEEFRSLSMQREVKTGANLSVFLLWAIFALLAVSVLIYLLAGGEDELREPAFVEQPAPSAAPPAISEDFVVEDSVASAAPAELVPAVPPAVVPPVAIPADNAEPAQEASATPVLSVPVEPVAEERLQLQLRFAAECWIELSADGRRLLYGLEKPGSERSFSVKPPLRFFVGNVDAVSINVAGVDYTIPRSVRTGRNTARFVLTAEDIEGLQ